MPWTAVSDVRCSMESSTLAWHAPVAGIGLGYLFAIEWANFTATWKKQKQVQEKDRRYRSLADQSIGDSDVVDASDRLFCSSKAYDNQFIVIILFPVFFCLSADKKRRFFEADRSQNDRSSWKICLFHLCYAGSCIRSIKKDTLEKYGISS